MDRWRATFLGLKQLPRELTAFEIEAFFNYTTTEREVIEARRRPELKLGLALQIGFLRMSGRPAQSRAGRAARAVAPSRPPIRCGRPGSRLTASDVPACADVD